MNELIGRVFNFEKHTFPNESALYNRLASDGQSPKALMISCADSRIVPEHIMQAQPGDLFVCRNAGNIVPPHATQNGGVTSTVEYAVMVLGVRDIIVCGHSDCGAMKALSTNADLTNMPNVAAWLRHSHAAQQVCRANYPDDLSDAEKLRNMALENVVAQLAHRWRRVSRVAISRCTAGMSTFMPGRCWGLTGSPAAFRRCVKMNRCRSPFLMRAAWPASANLRKPRSKSC